MAAQRLWLPPGQHRPGSAQTPVAPAEILRLLTVLHAADVEQFQKLTLPHIQSYALNDRIWPASIQSCNNPASVWSAARHGKIQSFWSSDKGSKRHSKVLDHTLDLHFRRTTSCRSRNIQILLFLLIQYCMYQIPDESRL